MLSSKTNFNLSDFQSTTRIVLIEKVLIKLFIMASRKFIFFFIINDLSNSINDCNVEHR